VKYLTDRNWKGVDISDNVKRNAETLSKPHVDLCVRIFADWQNLLFWTLPTLLYPVSGNNKEYTSLGASLPEDGSRVGFQNVFFWKDIEYLINKKTVPVSNKTSSKPCIIEYFCCFIYVIFLLLFFPLFILSFYNCILF